MKMIREQLISVSATRSVSFSHMCYGKHTMSQKQIPRAFSTTLNSWINVTDTCCGDCWCRQTLFLISSALEALVMMHYINLRFFITLYYNQWHQSIVMHTGLPQPFYDPFSGTTQVSRCQKRTSGLYGARRDKQRQTHRPSGWAPLHPD